VIRSKAERHHQSMATRTSKAKPIKKSPPRVTSVVKRAGGEAQTALFLSAELNARPSDFELGRAIHAYVPLLKASYAMAMGNPDPDLPPGFEDIGRIDVSGAEMAEAAEALDPKAREAVENDLRAMGLLPPLPGPEAAREAIPNPERFGVVARETATGAVIVSIRGTKTWQEWVKNLTVVPTLFFEAPTFGLVHLGFEIMWRRIRSSVLQALKAVPAGARVTFLGHSLGGAMAVLAALAVRRNYGKLNVDVCTMGGPRTGKVVFRVKYNKLIPRCYRITNQGDIVPHVPSVITGWNHTGVEIEVNGKTDDAHALDSYLAGLRRLEPGIPGAEAAGVVIQAATL
jgi:hypothetical protein